jgi:thioredoxin reductase
LYKTNVPYFARCYRHFLIDTVRGKTRQDKHFYIAIGATPFRPALRRQYAYVTIGSSLADTRNDRTGQQDRTGQNKTGQGQGILV